MLVDNTDTLHFDLVAVVGGAGVFRNPRRSSLTQGSSSHGVFGSVLGEALADAQCPGIV